MLRPSVFTGSLADSVFDGFFNDSFWPTARINRSTTNMMKTDVKETAGGYQIEMELPGFSRENVQADLKDGYLTIEASRSETKEDKREDEKYLRRERYAGHCRRSFYVGEAVDQEDIKARFKDGVLILEVPKKEAKPEVEEKRYIPIEG